MTLEFATNWNLALGIGLVCMWLMWAAFVWDDFKGWVNGRDDIIVGCLCRTRHKAGECPRDRNPEEEE